jgi:hypothetical protein
MYLLEIEMGSIVHQVRALIRSEHYQIQKKHVLIEKTCLIEMD